MPINIDSETHCQSEETLISKASNLEIDLRALQRLSQIAKNTKRARLRLCAHQNDEDPIHEMFIVHPKRAYVPPHKHLNKSESILILSGNCDYFIFSDQGEVKEKLSLGCVASGDSFFFRLQEPLFHTLLIHSPELIFLEITKGPFLRHDTVLADWAPDQTQSSEIESFHAYLADWSP